MAAAATEEALARRLGELSAVRGEANRIFFEAQAERLARLCQRMAERFARGGRLLALGRSPAARSDARHVAVEFVHPVIVGKRALPAIALDGAGGPLDEQLAALAAPGDLLVAFGGEELDGETAAAVTLGRERGCLTIAFSPGGAEWELVPPEADPFVRQELVETAYHVLWELVHVFFEHRGLLAGREARPLHDAGAASFLYPFLAEGERDLEAVLEDVRGSLLAKAAEVGELRERTLGENRDVLLAAAASIRRAFEAGGVLLAFGNGGSATDAADLVADLRAAPQGWPARPAIDLSEDAAILSAIANDVGVEEVFQRQLIAQGREGDVAVAISTSGDSPNLIEALAEARRRGLATLAFAGYDGGRIAAERLADHVVVTRSQHIPRIQEAQASAYHALRELIELAAPGAR
jgi:D-sedoheptulose 7-phosphate isomerase